MDKGGIIEVPTSGGRANRRNDRNESIPHERCVVARRPHAVNSAKYAATGRDHRTVGINEPIRLKLSGGGRDVGSGRGCRRSARVWP
jgi:hypothetical protein